MAQILQFPGSMEPRSKPSKTLRAGKKRQCEIVIFPGIRVEYHDDHPDTVDLSRRVSPTRRTRANL